MFTRYTQASTPWTSLQLLKMCHRCGVGLLDEQVCYPADVLLVEILVPVLV